MMTPKATNDFLPECADDPSGEGLVAGMGRRRMLGMLASGAAVLGLNSAAVAAAPGAVTLPAREGEIAPKAPDRRVF
jgi:hypothetical protein